ncbi:MAG: KGG domain-containing protein [Vicinamibacterales bacterium]
MATEDRGFASMDPEKQRAIARKGGRAAHEKGTAHEWTTEEARKAGRKGGLMSHQRRRERKQGDPSDNNSNSSGNSDIGSSEPRAMVAAPAE